MRSPAATDLGLATAVLVAVTVIAELAGAANLGTALSFGTIAFTAVLMWAMLRPPTAPRPDAGRPPSSP